MSTQHNGILNTKYPGICLSASEKLNRKFITTYGKRKLKHYLQPGGQIWSFNIITLDCSTVITAENSYKLPQQLDAPNFATAKISLKIMYTLYMLYFKMSCVYCCHLMCICCTMCVVPFFTLDAGLLARSQYSEGPATGHLDTGFSWFPCVYKQMLRLFPKFQVATTCFSCSPPDWNLLVTNFIFCIHVK